MMNFKLGSFFIFWFVDGNFNLRVDKSMTTDHLFFLSVILFDPIQWNLSKIRKNYAFATWLFPFF